MQSFLLAAFGLIRFGILGLLTWGWLFLEERSDFLNASKVTSPVPAMIWVGLSTCLTYACIFFLFKHPSPKSWRAYLGLKTMEILAWLLLFWMSMEPVFRTVVALDRIDVKIISVLMLLVMHLVGILLVASNYQKLAK